MAKSLIIVGLILTAVSVQIGSDLGRGWPRRLAGGLQYMKGEGFYVPIFTCLLIGQILTIVAWLFRK